MPGSRHSVITRFNALGDVVLTTPFVRALRASCPDDRLTFVTRRRYAGLLAPDPHLDAVVALDDGEPLAALARRVGAADRYFDLQRNVRSYRLWKGIGGYRSRTAKARAYRRLRVWTAHTPVPPLPAAERYFAAAADLGVVPDGKPAHLTTTPAAEDAAAAIAEEPGVILAPGAAHGSKRWPATHWAALADALTARGLRTLGLGTGGDRFIAGGMTDAFGTPLDVAAALCRRARVVVANDSGLMHVAAAVGTPVVALFGPTVPDLGFAPYRSPARTVEIALTCRPCSAFGGAYCPAGHHRCLTGIVPAAVARYVEGLL